MYDRASRPWVLAALSGLFLVTACTDTSTVPTDVEAQFAKGGGGVTVDSADPNTALQGVTIDVQVIGSGFDESSTVQFLLAGKSTPKILTNSSTFIDGNNVTANITIAADADVASYDIKVTASRGRKGIGSEIFAVEKNPGNGGGTTPVLDEYWVYEENGGNLIHVAGSGKVDEVNPNVVFDHFFNGIRDDNAPSDQHYEYVYGGPPAESVSLLPDGRWHVDVQWNGERPSSYAPGDRLYPNAIITDVDGLGGDPYAFDLRFSSNGNLVGGDQPQGVTVGGVELGIAEASVSSTAHGEQDVTSYAIFSGASPEGLAFLASMTTSAMSCTLVNTGRGRGKNAATVLTASADYAITLGGLYTPPGDPVGIAWMELHLRDLVTGEISPRHTVSPSTPNVAGTITWELDEATAGVELQLVVDYLYPTGPFLNYVYDPEKNSVSTTAGFGVTPWSNTNPSTTAGDEDFPVAATGPVTLNCG